jgi:hypothetical protein
MLSTRELTKRKKESINSKRGYLKMYSQRRKKMNEENYRTYGAIQEEEKGVRVENMFEEIVPENFSNVEKGIHIQVQKDKKY